MIELCVDVETTGFPSSSKPLDHEDQPHIVQIGAILRDGGKIVGELNTYVVCPIEVPEGAFKIHSISKADTERTGMFCDIALKCLIEWMENADVFIAHNAQFDLKMLNIAAARHLVTIPVIEQFCTMKRWADHHGSKWPKLDQAYFKIAKNVPAMTFADSHHAYWDARKALAIYDHLIECEDLTL